MPWHRGTAHSAPPLGPRASTASTVGAAPRSWGSLGLGDTEDRDEPCLVERLSNAAVRQLHCGTAHTVVVCDGSVAGARHPMSGASYERPVPPRSRLGLRSAHS